MGSGAGNFLKVLLRNFDVLAGYVSPTFMSLSLICLFFFFKTDILHCLFFCFYFRPVVSLVYPL